MINVRRAKRSDLAEISNPMCEIENMFIEEIYRKQGLGKLLMDHVKEIAQKKDVKRLRVGAIAQNEHAIHFYRTNGLTDTNLYLEMEVTK